MKDLTFLPFFINYATQRKPKQTFYALIIAVVQFTVRWDYGPLHCHVCVLNQGSCQYIRVYTYMHYIHHDPQKTGPPNLWQLLHQIPNQFLVRI